MLAVWAVSSGLVIKVNGGPRLADIGLKLGYFIKLEYLKHTKTCDRYINVTFRCPRESVWQSLLGYFISKHRLYPSILSSQLVFCCLYGILYVLTVCLQYHNSLASCNFSASLLSCRDKQFLRFAYLHLAGTLSSKTAEDLLSRSSALMWNAKWLLSLSQSAVWDHMHYKQTNFLFL